MYSQCSWNNMVHVIITSFLFICGLYLPFNHSYILSPNLTTYLFLFVSILIFKVQLNHAVTLEGSYLQLPTERYNLRQWKMRKAVHQHSVNGKCQEHLTNNLFHSSLQILPNLKLKTSQIFQPKQVLTACPYWNLDIHLTE